MDLTRRQLLKGGAGAGTVLAGGKAVDNVLLGYDRFTGTNLLRQDLDPLVLAELHPSGREFATVDGYRLDADDWTVSIREDGEDRPPLETLDLRRADPAEAAALDADLGLADGALEELVADLGSLTAGEVELRYSSYPDFFEYCAGAETRPVSVAALRGRRTADPDLVTEFSGASPTDPPSLVEGLVGGFREHTSYDVERYLAGSVEDNVLFGAADLRGHFESPADFEALLEGENEGMFCYELVRRSVEAVQSVSTGAQSPPLFAGYVWDERHKHAYTTVGSVVRDDGDLVVPVTFLDYTHSTLYDDLRGTWALGEGLDAYGDRHRATRIRWYR